MIKKCVHLLSLLLLVFPIFSQQSAEEALSGYIKNINQFNTFNPQEKVYLHFDNTGYYLGDTIWFKAYVVLAEHIHPTPLSKVLHVELLTPEGETIANRVLKIEDGRCYGEFDLDKDDYLSGFYEVRAYTRSMLNFGNDCIFSRVFPVYGEPETEEDYSEKTIEPAYGVEYTREKREKQKKVNLSFYPEGGNAVIGLRSKIAFKSTGEKGQDIQISGTVYNQSDEAVTTFSTLHQGMGFFDLTPETPEYKVVVEYEGKKHTFPLKEIISSGYALRVNNLEEETMLIQLQKSPAMAYDTIGVSVSCRGKVYAFESIAMAGDPYILRLPKDNLPSGCLQITVFDKQGTIHSERLVFNNSRQTYLPVQVKQDKNSYRPFEKVKMEFSVSDTNGHPQETSFSLAIRDVGTEHHTAYQDNILTDLLLSSDAKGHIANPMQYFENNDRATRMKLDLLMLVQGWRRYNWQQMAGVIPFEAGHYAEEGLPVSGKIVAWLGKKEKEGVDVLIWMTKDGKSFHGKAKTDEKGNFYFLLPDSVQMNGYWQLGVQTSEKGKRKDYRIMLDRVFSPQGRSYTIYDTNVKDTVMLFEGEETDSLYRRSIEETQLLPDIVVKKKRRRYPPNVVYDVEKDIDERIDRGERYPYNVDEYLEEVSGYWFEDKSEHQDRKTGKTRYKMGSSLILGLLPDGKTFGFGSEYKRYSRFRPIEEVKRIVMTQDPKVLNRFSAENLMAVFRVYPFKDKVRLYSHKGIRYTRFAGYSQVKEFYHVDNSDKILGDVDFRRTLYWNPDVKTDKNGKATVSFYNNSTQANDHQRRRTDARRKTNDIGQ